MTTGNATVDQHLLAQGMPSALLPSFAAGNNAPDVLRNQLLVHAPYATTPNADRIYELVSGVVAQMWSPWEAFHIIAQLYAEMCSRQEASGGVRIHKAMPLVWAGEHLREAHCRHSALRFFVLCLIEDALQHRAALNPATTGIHFRLRRYFGFTDAELADLAEEAIEIADEIPGFSRHPEYVLTMLKFDWSRTTPTDGEFVLCLPNSTYLKRLLGELGSGTGRELELIASHLMTSIPGVRARIRAKTKSSDIDVSCAIDGPLHDFRSEIGRHFICECKDWAKPADFSTMAKFGRVIESSGCRFGVLFSKNGISGEGSTKDAEREQFRLFSEKRHVVVVVTEADLRTVADDGVNFVSLLRQRYDRIRLDTYD